jgi:hypothetical protein
MSIDGKGILQTVWGLIVGGAKKLPLLPAAEQTMLSWAKAIESHDEVPQVYRASFEALVGRVSKFPYTVLTPSYAGFIRRAKEKLVCCVDGKVYVLEEARGDITSTCYPIGNISYIEVGTVLLQSWVKIRGVASDGVLTSSEFKFNTVTDHLFTPIVERIRPAADCSERTDLDVERSKFNYLSRLSLKLTNYARRSLMPGERVVHFILQQEVRAEVFRLLGRSLFRTISVPHLSILTDKELIIVRDGIGKQWGKGVRYGGVWHYISLKKIASILLTDGDNDLLIMSINLPGNDRIDALFSVSNRREVDLFLTRFESLVPEAGIECVVGRSS